MPQIHDSHVLWFFLVRHQLLQDAIGQVSPSSARIAKSSLSDNTIRVNNNTGHTRRNKQVPGTDLRFGPRDSQRSSSDGALCYQTEYKLALHPVYLFEGVAPSSPCNPFPLVWCICPTRLASWLYLDAHGAVAWVDNVEGASIQMETPTCG